MTRPSSGLTNPDGWAGIAQATAASILGDVAGIVAPNTSTRRAGAQPTPESYCAARLGYLFEDAADRTGGVARLGEITLDERDDVR